MKTRVKGGNIILGDDIVSGLSVYYENGAITDITSTELECGDVIDAEGRYVSAGFIDIHVHGGGGADFLDGTPSAFLTAAELHASHGSTTIVPTTTSGGDEETRDMINAYETAAKANTRGADMPGLHFEGPYFAASQMGAQDPRYLRNPQPAEYMKILDSSKHILRWSVACELDGALEMGAELKRRGILAAIGHTDAECAQVERAFEAGYTHMTHLYSSMSTVHRVNAFRHAGALEAAYLIDDMTVEIIADGCHLPAELLRFVYKFKGADKTALITDAMRGAGMPDGVKTMLGHKERGMEVIIEDGVAKLPDRQSFAGSVATTDRLVRNMVYMAKVPLSQAVKMATKTPARIMGFADRGELKAGLRADIAVFNDNIDMSDVIVGGRRVYKKGGERE